MKTKPPAQSVIFNSRFLIGLFVFLPAVFLFALGEFATANPSGLGLGASRMRPLNQTWQARCQTPRKEKDSNPASEKSILLRTMCRVLWESSVR